VEKFQSSQNSPQRNPENPILRRWAEILSARKREAAIFAPDGSPLRSFDAIEEEACRLADRLPATGTIAIQIGNDPAWPALILSVWKKGLSAVPLEGDLTSQRREKLEALAGATLRVEQGAGELRFIPLAPRFPAPAVDFLKATSGTTGEPRLIRFTAAELLADCDNICASMGITNGDRNYGVISFGHSYGFSNLITPLLATGVPLVAASDKLPRPLRAGLEASGATVFPAVPALLRSLAEIVPAPHRLRLCISAGAPLPAETSRRFHEQWNLKVHSFYGSSECGGICYDAGDELPEVDGYVGAPLDGVAIRLKETSIPSPIEIQSRAVGEGYYPEEDPSILGGGAFHPADLLSPLGNGFAIAGRMSDLINVGGRKVNPAEIERVLRLSPSVRDVVVLGVPAAARGEEIAACVVGEIREAELLQLCSRHLPAWQAPRRWCFLEKIPVNARGKISRADLRALAFPG